jgi:mannose-6-phosphate isomerase-like protein (cupin superfamily)
MSQLSTSKAGIPLAAVDDYTREMRSLIVVGLLLSGYVVEAQTPTAPKPATPPPPTSKPAQPPQPAQPAQPAPKPAPKPAPRPAPARAGMAITVTDSQGMTLPGVRVEVVGTSDRSTETNGSGQANFTAMQAGTYRVRLSGERVITFEKEVVVRAGQIADVDVMLSLAPPPPPPPPPPAPAPVAAPAPSVGPAGEARVASIVGMIEKELISGNQPRRDSLVSCSGNMRTTLVQLNQDQAQRLYDTAEVTYYVVAGEGAVRLGDRDTKLVAGSFVSVPRGTAHSIIRSGRRPLILLATLSGTPCEEPR